MNGRTTQAADIDPGTSAAAPSSGRPVVWVLDDSPTEAAMARRALAPYCDIQTFLDGPNLLECIAAGSTPNVLVLDWKLPGMSGIEVCRFLRAARDEMELPILMLTVYGHKSDLIDGLSAGANDYLTKPYDAPELAARVGSLARISMLHDKARRAERKSTELLSRERAARADAESANRAKDDFVAMVSHELRTPLNAILGWTRMIRGGSVTAPQLDKALATIERNALAQTQLIDDLMDVSSILSGRLAIERQSIELVQVIQNAVDAVRPSATMKGIKLQLHIDADTGSIEGDPARLQQVIWNLLANAIKFTPQNGEVVISTARGDSLVQLSVVDSGPGIPADFLPHVFERFRQGNIGPKRVHGGLGLGLAIVKHIVELHGGSVEARSDGVGQGATFVVMLPRETHSMKFGVPMSDPPQRIVDGADSARLSGLNILIVDDDADALELLSTMLKRHGASVISTQSVEEALGAIDTHLPDLLVSDIAMPGRDGHDMIREIRSFPPNRGGKIPALALTAYSRPQDRTRALVAGFNMHASKPIDPSELILSVASLAGRFEGLPTVDSRTPQSRK